MLFFEECVRGIDGAPIYSSYTLRDCNPLSGHEKRRVICNPNRTMRIVHGRLIRYIRKLPVSRVNSTGGVPGMSPLKNIRLHARGSRFPRHFFLVDISGAYQSVDPEKLVEVLCVADRELGGSRSQVRVFLDLYCLSRREGGLLVGAPASPDLFNLYCEVLLDPSLRDLCRKYNLTYTRYLDDITFSSLQQPIGKKKRRALRAVIDAVGFALSPSKTQVLDLRKGPIFINGVGVREDGQCFLPRHAVDELRGLLHLALTAEQVDHWKEYRRIHGKMGMFKALTNPKNPNRTEQRVLEMYRGLHLRCKKQRSVKL